MVEWHTIDEIMDGYDGEYCLGGTLKLRKKIKTRWTNPHLDSILYGDKSLVIEIHPNGKKISDGADNLLILCKFFAGELAYKDKYITQFTDVATLKTIQVAFDIVGKSPREVKEKKEKKCNAILF